MLTFLSYSVKDFNLLQVDSKAHSHGYGIRGIILVAPSDGPIGMCSAKKTTYMIGQTLFNSFKASQLLKLKITDGPAEGKDTNFSL